MFPDVIFECQGVDGLSPEGPTISEWIERGRKNAYKTGEFQWGHCRGRYGVLTAAPTLVLRHGRGWDPLSGQSLFGRLLSVP